MVKRNSQCNDIEGNIIACYTSPNTVVWGWWICPVIQHIIHVPKWLLYLQQSSSFKILEEQKPRKKKELIQIDSWKRKHVKRE